MGVRGLVRISLLSVAVLSLTSMGLREDERPERDPVLIALTAPLSGPWAAQGEQIFQATQLATSRINEAGGVRGRPLELTVGDSRGEPRVAAELARVWSEDPRIIGAVGDFSLSPSFAAQRIFDAGGLVQISPSVRHPEFAKGSPWSFSMVGLQEGEGSSNARFAFNSLGYRRAAILYREGSWGSRLAGEFEEQFTALGGEVVATEFYFDTDLHLERLLDRLGAQQPELLYLVARENEASRVCKVFERRNPAGSARISIVSPSKLYTTEFLYQAGVAAEGLYASGFYSPEFSDSAAARFHADFEEVYGAPPSLLSALAYDTILVLADALERAPLIDRLALRESLEMTEGFEGVTGAVRFSAAGNAVRSYHHLVVRDGAFLLLPE